MLLAAIGTYGVLSYMVAERRREIGIRMALGADQGSVLAQVMKQGLMLTTIGIVVGLAGAFALNRLIASLLFGVQPTDPIDDRRRGRDDHARRGGRVLAARLARVARRSERRVAGRLAACTDVPRRHGGTETLFKCQCC